MTRCPFCAKVAYVVCTSPTDAAWCLRPVERRTIEEIARMVSRTKG